MPLVMKDLLGNIKEKNLMPDYVKKCVNPVRSLNKHYNIDIDRYII